MRRLKKNALSGLNGTEFAFSTFWKEVEMEGKGSGMEVVKLILISLALVFAVAAFAMVLLKGDGDEAARPVRTLQLPDPPKPPPIIDDDKAAKILWQQKMAEAKQQEIDNLKDKQNRADEAVAKLKEKYAKDGALPEKIVLETPTDRPKPENPEQEAMPNSAPLDVFVAGKRVEFDAYVILDKGQLIEVLFSGPRGRLHESLLLTYINPYDLWQALALLGLKQSYTARGEGDMVDIEGDRVIIEVEFEDKDGKKQRKRIEDLIYHFQLNTHMPYEGWVYTGSYFAETRSGDFVLVGEKTENVATIWHRPTSILENPSKEGGDDSLYRSYEGVVPPAETKLRVIMTPDEEYNGKRPEAQPLMGR